MNQVLHAIRRAAELELTDGQLLAAYADHRDGAAFGELVRRHGPMVWGVCRRLLANRADAEDAFQATFLVLVRKPGSVRPAERVGNWLHGVAVHAARKAVRSAARRREHQVEALPEPGTVSEGIWHDLIPVLDEEIARLPEKYRLPIMLCDLESCTRREAAERLGWPEGTVAGRLALGRALLAKRLTRHGLPVSGGVLGAVLSAQDLSAAAPAKLLDSAARAAAGGAVGPAAHTLAEGVLRAMSAPKLVSLAAVVLVAVGGGFVLWAQPGGPATSPEKPPAVKAKEKDVDAAWGKEVNGLRAGVGFAPGHKGAYRVGGTATLVVYLQNVSGKELAFEYTDGYLAENQPAVTDAGGRAVATSRLPILLGVWLTRKKSLAAGEVMELGRVERVLEPARAAQAEKPTLFVGPGKYKLSYTGVLPNSGLDALVSSGRDALVSTGQLDLEVAADTLTPVFGQDGWRFAATYWNATADPVDLPRLLQASAIVLDGKEYPRQILKFGGGSKLRPGENWSFTVAAGEYLPKDLVLAEGRHTLKVKFAGQEFGPVEFEWRK